MGVQAMTADLTASQRLKAESMHMSVEVRIAADKIDELETENEKLRQLVRDMWQAIPKTESCGWDSSANTCTGIDECRGECALWHRMHDLGIEVDDINQNNFKSTKNLGDLNEVREVDE